MQKLIGIRGHRGAGKESVAYLLACTLEFINNTSTESYQVGFEQMYKNAVEKLVDDKDEVFRESNFQYVYLDAFGDAPKAMVQQLLGCSSEYIWDEYWKDHVVVDLKTFNIEEVEELPDGLIDYQHLKYYVPSCFDDSRFNSPVKMSLRDFILYFGQTVMQKYFGRDVWVKSTAQNDKMNEGYLDEGFRIYTDIKAPTELSYLIDKHAVIINVERRGYKKRGGLDLLKDDTRWDYNVQIKGNDLMSIKDDILKIAENIYWDNGKENS